MIGVKVLEADSTMVPWLKAVWLRDGRVIHSEVLSQTAGFSGLLSGEVVAPRGATSLKVELRGSGIGTTIFDDASIRDAGGNELLTSGGFEGDMDGWRTWRWRGNLGLVTIVQRADESGKALRVAAQPTWNGAESLSLFNQQGRASALAVAKQRAVDYFAVVSGQSYTLNLSTRLVGVEQEALVQVRFYDAQGQGVGTAISSALLQGDAEWQWLSLAGEAPEGAVTAQVVVKLTGRGHVLTDMAVLIGK